jgi:hypothetical protein
VVQFCVVQKEVGVPQLEKILVKSFVAHLTISLLIKNASETFYGHYYFHI